MDDYVKVAVRVRPNYYNSEEDNTLEIIATDCVRLNLKDCVDYTYDKVFDCDTSQEEIFNFTKPIIDGFVEGYNGTIFAYGQTGSGKTFTMFGKDHGNGLTEEFYRSEDRGLIPRAIDYLFNQLEFSQHENETFKWTLKCSFIELYMEKFYDLLEQGDHTLRLRTIGDKTVIEGATEKILEYPSEVFQVILEGWTQRSTGQTRMNERSSRSHAIFILELDTSEVLSDGILKKRNSRLNLVDLAGSEKQKDTYAEGTRFEEGKRINLSLLTLGKVIRAISKSGTSHIPYRESMLTQLLKDSLGGNSRAMTIVNVHPNKNCAVDTHGSLIFARDLKMVKNRAQINQAYSAEKIEAYIQRIENLESELERAKEDISDRINELQERNMTISELKNKAERFEKRAEQFENLANTMEVDSINWKTQLMLKDQSLRLLNDRLKSNGDFQIQKITMNYEKRCEDIIRELKARLSTKPVADDDIALEIRYRTVCSEKDRIKEELNATKQEKVELEHILKKTTDRLNEALSSKRHEAVGTSFARRLLGTPIRRQNSIDGLPQTQDEVNHIESEKRERRRMDIGPPTSRRLSGFTFARNLFNVSEIAEPESARLDEQTFKELEGKLKQLEETNRDLEFAVNVKQWCIEELQKTERVQFNELCKKNTLIEHELNHIKELLDIESKRLAESENERIKFKESALSYQKMAQTCMSKMVTYDKTLRIHRDENQKLNEKLVESDESRLALQQNLDELKLRYQELKDNYERIRRISYVNNLRLQLKEKDEEISNLKERLALVQIDTGPAIDSYQINHL